MNKKGFYDYFYVGIQLLLFAGLLLCPTYWEWSTSPTFHWIGIVLFVIGITLSIFALFELGSALTPYPTPKEQGQLKTSGLYRYIRHPIYTSIILAFTGWAIYKASSLHLILVAGLLLLFYFKTRYEESLLINKYGQVYRVYQSKTGRFFPKFN